MVPRAATVGAGGADRRAREPIAWSGPSAGHRYESRGTIRRPSYRRARRRVSPEPRELRRDDADVLSAERRLAHALSVVLHSQRIDVLRRPPEGRIDLVGRSGPDR